MRQTCGARWRPPRRGGSPVPALPASGWLVLTLLISLIAIPSVYAQDRISPIPRYRPRPATSRSIIYSWVTLRVGEITINSNAGKTQTLVVADRLRRMRAAMDRFDDQPVRHAVPTTVWVFRDVASYQPFRDALFSGDRRRTSGVFVAHPHGNFILLDLSAGPRTVRTAYHELTHDFLNRSRPDAPLWLSEGLAELYSTFATDRDGIAYVGHPIVEHTRRLRSRELIPFETFLSINSTSHHYNTFKDQHVFYAQSWIFVHYLLSERPGGKESLDQYLDAVARRIPQHEAFPEAFGVEPAVMAGELRDFLRRKTVEPIRVSRPDVEPQPIGRVVGLTHDEVAYRQGDLLLHIEGPGSRSAGKRFHYALDINADHARAHVGVALGLEADGQESDAAIHLARALAAAPDDPEVLITNGEYLLRRIRSLMQASSMPPSAWIDEARRNFIAALGADRSSARAWSGLGACSIYDEGDVMVGIAAIEESLRLLPNQRDALFNLAVLYARSGDRQCALSIIEREFGDAYLEVVRERALQAVRHVDLLRANQHLRNGEPTQALSKVLEVMATTTDEGFLTRLERDATGILNDLRRSREIDLFNDAAMNANRREFTLALSVLDSLLATASDPEVLGKSKDLRERIVKVTPRPSR